jgi:F-box-like
MSGSSISQSNALGVDVLLMIFQQLDGEDLLNCEAVCCQWRDILLAGTPWRRLFHRNIAALPLWRKVQKKLKKNQLILQTEQYREVSKAILQVERNWRTAQFKNSVYLVKDYSGVRITISDDYVAWDLDRNENGEPL